MKIGEYEQMMSYLTRKDFAFGGGADAQRMGTEASREYFKNRPVDKPTPTFEGGKGKAKVTDVKFKNPTQEKEYIKILKDRFKFPKGSKEAKKIASNEDIAKKFGITINNVERVNKALINKLDLKYPTQTYEGYEKIQRDRDKFRKENIKKTSSEAVESKIKRDIKTVDPKALAKDVDIAHRASLKANANLGEKYLVSSLGIDKKIINQSIIKPIEQKLGTLYNLQKDLIKGLEPGNIPKETQKQIEKLNIKISELADRTNGVLQGVLVDEKTLKPKVYGVDYSKVLGFGLVDKPVSELTQSDRDLIKLNVGEQIKLAKKVNPKQPGIKLKAALLPGLEQIAEGIKNIPDDIAKKRYFTLGLKALGPIGTYIAADDTYEALKAGRPVAEALEYGLIGTNLIGSAKDLMALSPEEREARSVVKQAEMADQIAQDESMLDSDFETPKVKSDLTKEEAEEKFEAAKARRKLERESQEADIAKARATSIQGLKDLITGKRFAGQEMPTQYMAAGGRMGFADGPDDPSRRKFMKIAGGIASIPIVGKFLKPAMVAAPKVVEVVKRSADGIPEFIGDLVTKVVTFGKKNFTGNRSDEFADQYRLDDYVVTQQGNKTTIQKFDDPDNPNYKEIEIELETDPETGGVTYNEASVRPDAEGKLKDVEEYIDDLDLEDMKKYTYDE